MTDAVKALTEAQLDEIEWKVADQAKRYTTIVFDAATVLSLVSMSRAALAAQGEAEPEPVAWPEGMTHCGGSSLVFSEGVLHVSKDGSGYIAVAEKHFTLRARRGSVHWVTRFQPDEMQALKDFLNGVQFARPTPPADAAGAIPKGWKLVPEAMTYEHYKRFLGRELLNLDRVNFSHTVRDYRAMLTAAPSPPSAADDERLQRLRDAIEGECNGLAIDDETAKKILAYLSPAGHAAISARSSSPLPDPEQNQDQQIDPDRP